MAENTNGVASPLGEGVSVSEHRDGEHLTLVIKLQGSSDCVLHWGLSRRPGGPWRRPPDECWPEGTTPVAGQAVRTPFPAREAGDREVALDFDLPCPAKNLAFVLHFPRENRWVRSGGRDFSVQLPNGQGHASPEEALASWAPGEEVARRVFPLDGAGSLAVATLPTPEGVRVSLACDAGSPLVLHWGVAWRFKHEWQLPPEGFRPAGTSVFEDKAARTPFGERGGLQYLELEFLESESGRAPRGMSFVLHQPDDNAWLKSGGKEMYLPLFEPERDPRVSSPALWDLADEIVGAEKGASAWTLMHRFNLCHDLLGRAQDEEALALLFAWLRYSATRQLDWQRRYNTKPRDLSHAQDRLTTRLAGLYRKEEGGRPWLRLMLTTLGRGGEGQRVRDEILQIMHRHHIKEVSGSFIEEWHQKLHNNTTPDDVVICEAYLAFLKSNGDLGRFYQALEAGGVPRERLRGFERPIKTDPTFDPGQKDALIGEFENFLRTLKSVHSGTDLETAASAVRGRLSEGLRQKLDALLSARQRGAAPEVEVKELAPAATAVREGLKEALASAADDAALRDLLFLDLALEDLVRGLIERQNLSQLDRDRLAELVRSALRNLNLSVASPEPAVCAGHWASLLARPRAGRDWALHARSVADRAARWVQGFTTDLYRRLQPKAEFLGEALGMSEWAIPLFSEEVIRGGPAFALALLLRPLDRILRKEAGLGGWQVISPARASGRVRGVDRLLAVQAERFAEATVLVADAVSGNEEIPEGVTAVLTRDSPDLVSHVAVRARNAHVLFATCFEPAEYDRLKGLAGRNVALQVTPGGDVVYEEKEEGGRVGGQAGKPDEVAKAVRLGSLTCNPSSFKGWVITHDQFTPEVVGGKANNLNGLRGRLPGWIHLPASVALPFGAFERALQEEGNREMRREYEALVAAAEQDPAEVLARVRELVRGMAPPRELRESLLEAWQRVGLPRVPWEQAWSAIRRVWASKWNERAYLSRRARRIPHDSLRMAVLVQQVVPADYAYVIHTANPLTGNRGEVYAEVVLGLGETLVGNYPGRALGFVCRKADLALELLSYPGKSLGLYGRGVIFRSDSNGEDLEGFAGAGLYDSFLAEEPEHRLLDYRNEKLVWDPNFRDELLRSIARVGLEVEKALGSPQDIEGAVAGGQLYIVQTRPQVGLAAP